MIPLSKNISRNGPQNRSASPDFLLNLVALANFMRLSLLKGAHVGLSCAAWRGSQVSNARPGPPDLVSWSFSTQLAAVKLAARDDKEEQSRFVALVGSRIIRL